MRVTPRRKWQDWCLAAVVLPVAGWVMFEAQRTFTAEWATLATREQVTKWLEPDAKAPNSADWERALVQLQRGLELTPDDPDLHERMGDLHSLDGRHHWNQADLRNRHFENAAKWYESSLQLRPGSGATWAALATSRQALGDPPVRVQQAWSQALKMAPFEGHVQPVLLQVVLVDWNNASPAMQSWAKALFDRSDSTVREQINALARYYGLTFKPDSAR